MTNFKDLRILWNLPAYPPYHEGLYMEEYFYHYYKKYKSAFDDTGYTLIPVYWTISYWHQLDVQKYINNLPTNLKYFSVSQHDDAVREKLPSNTLTFSAGGNSGMIPIPLVCSSVPEQFKNKPKDIFCSFVGSNTHPVRQRMFEALINDPLYQLQQPKGWSFVVDAKDQINFFDITSRSKFTLCPRGYGAQSFRFYEALQMGSIPIYIHDNNKWLPYSDILDWEKFSILIHINEIDTLKVRLLSLTSKEIDEMVIEGHRVYNDYFALKNLPTQILRYLQQNK